MLKTLLCHLQNTISIFFADDTKGQDQSSAGLCSSSLVIAPSFSSLRPVSCSSTTTLKLPWAILVSSFCIHCSFLQNALFSLYSFSSWLIFLLWDAFLHFLKLKMKPALRPLCLSPPSPVPILCSRATKLITSRALQAVSCFMPLPVLWMCSLFRMKIPSIFTWLTPFHSLCSAQSHLSRKPSLNLVGLRAHFYVLKHSILALQTTLILDFYVLLFC